MMPQTLNTNAARTGPNSDVSHPQESQMASTADFHPPSKTWILTYFFPMFLFIHYTYPELLLNYKTLSGEGGRSKETQIEDRASAFNQLGGQIHAY